MKAEVTEIESSAIEEYREDPVPVHIKYGTIILLVMMTILMIQISFDAWIHPIH